MRSVVAFSDMISVDFSGLGGVGVKSRLKGLLHIIPVQSNGFFHGDLFMLMYITCITMKGANSG